MSNKNYSFIPQGDNAKDLWLKNFATKLPQFAVKYNITVDELNDMAQASTFFTYFLNQKNQLEEYLRRLSKFKNEMRDGADGNIPVTPDFPNPGVPPAFPEPGIFVRAASLGSRMKRHHIYTESDGLDLGIETVSIATVALESVQPTIKVIKGNGGHPQVRWTKKSMDAIEIHVDRGDGFEFLAVDVTPHFTDKTLPGFGETAVYKYRAIYIKDDQQVGQWSEETSITVTGVQS